MEMSLFLARWFGFYLVIVGLAYFFKRSFLQEVLQDFQNSAGLLMISSVINLLLGLFIVLNHNIWEVNWKVVLTILGYLIVLKGVLNLFFPKCMLKVTKKYMEKDIFVYSGVISLILGLYLLYYGYDTFFQKILGT